MIFANGIPVVLVSPPDVAGDVLIVDAREGETERSRSFPAEALASSEGPEEIDAAIRAACPPGQAPSPAPPEEAPALPNEAAIIRYARDAVIAWVRRAGTSEGAAARYTIGAEIVRRVERGRA